MCTCVNPGTLSQAPKSGTAKPNSDREKSVGAWTERPPTERPVNISTQTEYPLNV